MQPAPVPTAEASSRSFHPQFKGRDVPSIPLIFLSLSLFLLAIYPSVRWYLQRNSDRSDEPLGLVALATAIYFLFQQRRSLQLRHPFLISGSLILIALHLLPWRIPPMILAALGISILLLALHLPHRKSGLAALLVLSLPLMASLDFYIGYPMRLAAAVIAHGILNLLQLDVQLQGVMLNWQDQLIGVDPPCSGIRMLWITLFVTAILCTSRTFCWSKTLSLFALAIICVILGNSLRATILFFPESRIVHWPAWTHEGVGIAIQILLLIALQKLSSFRRPRITHSYPTWFRPLPITLSILALTAIAVSIAIPRTPSPPSTTPTWPATFNGTPLIPLALTEREQHFLKNFPGHIARFQCDHDEIILRQVTRPTRLLHSSTECLRASGFSLKAMPLFRDPDSNVWSHHQASFQGQRYHLKERIQSLHHPDQSHTDISAWYWSALLNPEQGPWLAITKLETIH